MDGDGDGGDGASGAYVASTAPVVTSGSVPGVSELGLSGYTAGWSVDDSGCIVVGTCSGGCPGYSGMPGCCCSGTCASGYAGITSGNSVEPSAGLTVVWYGLSVGAWVISGMSGSETPGGGEPGSGAAVGAGYSDGGATAGWVVYSGAGYSGAVVDGPYSGCDGGAAVLGVCVTGSMVISPGDSELGGGYAG